MSAVPPPQRPMARPADHPVVAHGKIGVLLVNLGSPDAPEKGAVRRYLKQFLSDRRVVEIPALIWQPILRGIVLNTRPAKSAHAYSQVWTAEGAPLIAITQRQAKAAQAYFGERVTVDFAMRYGNPAIETQIAKMKDAGCDRILIAPLYPQYSSATTGTVQDAAFATFAKMRWHPAVRTLPAYHDDPAYIDALKRSVEVQLAGLDFVPDALLASFHSMPERTLHLGDPYHCHCRKTARLLSEALGRDLMVSFQSRLGRAKWLEPATDKTLAGLAGQGIKKIAVITPGFSADNLETLEEIALRGREEFMDGGGTHFAFLDCLNDSEEGVALLTTLLSRELEGWLPKA
jgi:protoporphyrin/coproporphyrin ferrochelatase